MELRYDLNDLDPRISALIQSVKNGEYASDPFVHKAVYEKAFSENEGKSAAVKISEGYASFLEQKELLLSDNDLLAGLIQLYDYSVSMTLRSPKSPKERENYLLIDDGARNSWDLPREIAHARSYHHAEDKNDKRNFVLSAFLNGAECGMYSRAGSGHVLLGIQRVMTMGWKAIEEEAQAAFDTATEETRDCLQSILTCTKAARRYLKRWSELAAQKVLTAENEITKAAMERIAKACGSLADRPAQNFFEAVQSVALTHDLIICESNSGSLSLGRVDQYLYPYYKKDLEAGLINEKEGQDLIAALWVKFANLPRGFQHLTLGGCDENGSCAVNPVTIFCLRASGYTHFDQPLLSFRYCEGVDQNTWDEVFRLLHEGLGFPAIFSDETVMKAKASVGVAKEDLWRYGIIGCVEPGIPGDEYSNTEELRVNWAKVMEFMLLGEREQMPARLYRPLSEIKSFEEFLSLYKENLIYYTNLGMDAIDLLEAAYGAAWPAPLLSATLNDCIKKGKDATCGAAKYSFSSINGCGMADAVDSLSAINEFVFKRGLISLEELAAWMRSDTPYPFAQEEYPRFGNGIDFTDELMSDVADCFVSTIRSRTNTWGNPCQAGLYTVTAHGGMGAKTSALPSGRPAGVSLANAISPCQGADKNGPTAVVRSVTKTDLSVLGNGMVLDMKFTPTFLESEAHRQGMKSMILTYFKKGGQEIQFNIVDRETLLDAQEHPELYPDLVVRVSGFSAYFVSLPKVLQDEIIARTSLC